MKKNNLSSNKSFGILFFVVFILIALYPIIKDGNIRIWSIILAFIFLILGLLDSKLLTPLNKAWIKLGIILGNFISPIVLGIIFFFVVFPTGILIRLFKKNYIGIKYDKSLSSYWIKKNKQQSTMRNQF
tara:strand:- start:2381 stop:2767 length:387 start_codon:yes stop_codon:yes gene_type:complete